MNWSLEYYDGKLPLKEVSGLAWNDLDIHTVQRVYVQNNGYTMTMSGHDFYWVDEANLEFGCFIGPHNYDIYQGNKAVSFAIVDGVFIHTGHNLPGDGINILGSTYMPTDEAEEVGIL